MSEEADTAYSAYKPGPHHYYQDLYHLLYQPWFDVSSAEGFRKKRLEHRPDEGVCHQLPEKAWTAGPNAQNLWG